MHVCIYVSDIKPANYLSNADNTSFCLVDFGGALPITTQERVCAADQEKNTCQVIECLQDIDRHCIKYCDHTPFIMPARGGTEGYRAPEVLMRTKHQAYAYACIYIMKSKRYRTTRNNITNKW